MAKTSKPVAKSDGAKKSPGKPSPRRSAGVTLKRPAAPQPAPASDSAETQAALWKALPAEQKLALREREAARIFNVAIDHHQKGEVSAAIEAYGKSLLLNPKIPDVYNNMGVALRSAGKLEAAVACYRRCLVLRPNHPGVYSNLGNAYRGLGRLQLSVASHQQAVKLDPKNPEAYYNLGLALRDLGQPSQALAAFETTLRLKPDHAECRWDRSLTLLGMGDLSRGFAEYEWRWKLDRSPPRVLEKPLWDGSPLKGKTLLIQQEQGIGDMIQFARYIPLVKERVSTVVVETQPELARLMSTVKGADKVINRGSALPRFDAYIPMMTLARLFETTQATIPADIPYMSPPPGQSVQLLPSMENQRQIGIAWAGRPTHQNDKNRSCDFKQFIELLGIPGVNIYSLQKGGRESDIKENGCEALVIDMASRLNDFADTAALVSQLDLVITVDTSVAHLAGAMGKPVWVVVPFAADWRWGYNTSETPWYPSMRLFRQPQPGNWDQVFSDVRKALRAELGIAPPQPVRLR
ncbi:MAG: glycosyltransferase family protein [Rhodospirillales bacterium]|nr:glycosyltransferase family protein [Rhodospirillales bacterium]